MDYEQLIKNWHTRDSSEDPFSRFVFEYLAFVGFLLKVKFIEARTDRDAIQWLKQDEQIKHLYLDEIQHSQVLGSVWEEIRNELSETRLGNASGSGDGLEEVKWWNFSGDYLDQQSQEEQDKVKGVIYGLEDWENMVEFWYTIRCNLFHGSKNPESRRDQFLVERAHKTLNPLVEIFLNGSTPRSKVPEAVIDEAAERFAHILVQQIQEEQGKNKSSKDRKEELNP